MDSQYHSFIATMSYFRPTLGHVNDFQPSKFRRKISSGFWENWFYSLFVSDDAATWRIVAEPPFKFYSVRIYDIYLCFKRHVIIRNIGDARGENVFGSHKI
jgi:hypothetical protein